MVSYFYFISSNGPAKVLRTGLPLKFKVSWLLYPSVKNKSTYNLLGVSSEEITKLVAETCAYMAIVHPDYTLLANRVSVDALHKRTSSDIREVATKLYEFKDKAGRPAPLLCERTFNNIM
jgi:hypothetical protein